MRSFIDSFNKNLLSVYYVVVTILDIEQSDKNHWPNEAYILM